LSLDIAVESLTSKFPEVYFFRGSALDRHTLGLVGVSRAFKVVILANPRGLLAADVNFADAGTMAIALAVFSVCGDFRGENLIIELHNQQNMNFMDMASRTANLQQEDGVYPLFAGGKAFVSSISDILAAKSAVTRDIINLVHILTSLPFINLTPLQSVTRRGAFGRPQAHVRDAGACVDIDARALFGRPEAMAIPGFVSRFGREQRHCGGVVVILACRFDQPTRPHSNWCALQRHAVALLMFS
jgi:hypothetical protein